MAQARVEGALEALPRDQRPPRLGAFRDGGSVERVVRDRVRGSHDQDLGPGVRAAQADADGPHRAGDGHRGERQAPVHVQLRPRQDGQVLGPRVQQGDPTLPRAPLRRVLARVAPRAGRAHDGRQGQRVQGVGHANQDAGVLPLWPRQHRGLNRGPGE